MGRYIDADALKKDVEGFPNCYNGWSDTYDKAFIIGAIEEQPSIDIVRCKECKHNPWDFDRTDYTCIWDDDFADREQTPDDFCSYGEREGE